MTTSTNHEASHITRGNVIGFFARRGVSFDLLSGTQNGRELYAPQLLDYVYDAVEERYESKETAIVGREAIRLALSDDLARRRHNIRGYEQRRRLLRAALREHNDNPVVAVALETQQALRGDEAEVYAGHIIIATVAAIELQQIATE